MTLRGELRRPMPALQRRAALGLRPFTAPVTIFIPLGISLGPWGLGIISPQTLAHLDVVVTLALATLGVFIGVAGARQAPAMPRLFAAASLEGVITIGVVAGAATLLLGTWGVPLDLPAVAVALTLGVCASASAAPAAEQGGDPEHEIASRVADLDDVLPIVLGGLVIGIANPAAPVGPVAAALAILVGLGTAVCGWLLFERAEGSAERAVFVLGCLALLGGAAAFAGASPLLAGMVAGWFWVIAPGESDRLVGGDLARLEHPLVVLLLITAGASVRPDLLGVWLFVAYVTFRLSGKLIGGWAASRLAPDVAPSNLGAYLIPPGVIGIAFALNFAQVAPTAGGSVVFAVALGAVLCELLTLAVVPADRRA